MRGSILGRERDDMQLPITIDLVPDGELLVQRERAGDGEQVIGGGGPDP